MEHVELMAQEELKQGELEQREMKKGEQKLDGRQGCGQGEQN